MSSPSSSSNSSSAQINGETVTIDFIADHDTLLKACEQWQNKSVLAMDTEFIRVDTFYPIPALLQVYDGERGALVDVTAIEDLSPLHSIVSNNNIIKIFHACGEDLEVFDRLFGLLPSPLFDTQIAAALLGYGFSVGYSRLVKTLLDQELPLDESRSDWLQRPLSPQQLEYATLDVVFLFKLYEKFSRELQGKPKQEWLQKCCEEQLQLYSDNQNPENYFQRFRNAWRLSGIQQELLYTLSLWREEKAKQKNKPRNHIIRDKSLYGIAMRQPQNLAGFKNIEELHPRAVDRYGKELLTVIQQHEEHNGKQCTHSIPRPLPKVVSSLQKRLKQTVQNQAEQHNIAPEMLVRKKHYEDFVRTGLHSGDFSLPKELQGWRGALIGDTFLQLAQQWYISESSQQGE